MYIESDKTQQIDSRLISPHYTDETFRREKTVFLAAGYKLKNSNGYNSVACDGIEYNYDDRIRQWDYDKSDVCWKQIRETYDRFNSAEIHEQYLRLFFDDPDLNLVHIITGVNHSNGYYYRVYGYIRGKKDKPE